MAKKVRAARNRQSAPTDRASDDDEKPRGKRKWARDAGELLGAVDAALRPQDDTAIKEVAWSPKGNPAQFALIECPVFEVFFGGARGGGKTDGMLGEWVAHADKYGQKANGIM